MKISTIALTAAMIGGATIAGVTPADAALTTVCVGEGGPVNVPGDLVVPRGETCSLSGTTIGGDVRVARGANLIVESVTIDGRLTARNDAWVDLQDSAVGGRVALVNAYGFYGEGAQLGDNVVIRRNDETLPPAHFLSFDSSIAGNVNAQESEVALEGTTVAGNVVGRNATFVDVIDSVVEGRLRVVDTAEGSIVCDSEIYGNGIVNGNGGVVQLGGPGMFGDCDGANYWDGNLNIDDNDAAVSLYHNIVRGNLGGDGNDPAPTGDANRVRGNTRGQFVDLAPAGPSTKARTATTDADRTDESERDADERRDAAIAQARQAGPADL